MRPVTSKQGWPDSVPELITLQARRRPQAPAVTDSRTAISFEELERRSTTVAGTLRGLGAGPEAVVGIALPRSVAFVVAALGVLRAGAAYLPLELDYPAGALATMLEDAGAGLILTDAGSAGRLPGGGWRLLTLDQACAPTGGAGASSPAPEDLAYVVYTSGSTGRPKGVEITHRNLANLCRWHRTAFAITPGDRATQVASPAFDAAVWEIWPHLAAGAGIWIPDAETKRDPALLQRWLVETGITVSFLPTAMAEIAMRGRWPDTARLRLLLTGADTLRHHPPAGLPFTLVNNYGPSECTVVATSGTVPVEGDGLPSIGRPVDGAVIRILDEHLRPVPPGEEGELCIGGEGVGRGYRGMPELTAERFVEDPLQPGARLYRTGDMAQLRPDGEIAFRGRRDGQVKIRGFRIELEEIAAVLLRHPDVRTAAVTTWERAGEDTQLAAYVVAGGAEPPSPLGLRRFLEERLPAHMWPSAFVPVTELPLTANGKLDRRALPSPDDFEPSRVLPLEETERTAPGTLVEARVTEIVGDLLGVGSVGVEDNFFMLGGHSLLGTQLISRIRDAYGVELPLRSLFDNPTVEAISVEIEAALVESLTEMTDEEAERLLS